ncbi:thiolase C-terminal domain-containing protein [Streptomyces sp. NPDC096311]|uniref:thiolase C-terminal domain-containing protein n=1 Tax=Streptomyces sp. NPDC096311 TaxID=3366083 RepID=UPI0038194842
MTEQGQRPVPTGRPPRFQVVERGTRDVAIVGVGATPYYRRGASWPRTITEMAGAAILAACEDAGLSVKDIDGFAYYSAANAGYGETMDTAVFMETLGIPEVTFSAALTSGGGGSAGSIGLARAAIVAGDAKVVVTVMALQQAPKRRLGEVYASVPPDPLVSFIQPSGLSGPGHLMSVLTRRHMYDYGTRREAFAAIALSQRENASNRTTAIKRDPLTLDDYFNARMIADPLCLYDFCLETDGAVAVITTSADRAKDLRQKPVPVVAAAHGGSREWGRAFAWMGMPPETFTSSGHAPIAKHLYERAGVTPADIDVALLYDHFTPMVLMQLEDYGFCAKGEGGPFVESGAIRYKGGSIPVNTHGGQLSEAYIVGMTHIKEGVEQMRGTAVNQVADAELALVTGGPAHLPVSGLILGKAGA